jgi:putative SOS response-associated peptidase YedK
MCGRFTQYNSREEYLAFLGEEAERDIPYDPEPVGRYNVAPGTRVLLLSERRSQLHLDPVHWGYAPEWWNKPALINARSETAAGSRMFRPLWEHGRAIVFADGWFEWKQPFFIARECSLSAEDFTWHPVSRAVGNPGNQSRELIDPLA